MNSRYKNMNHVSDGLQMFTIVVRTSLPKFDISFGGCKSVKSTEGVSSWRFVGCHNEEPNLMISQAVLREKSSGQLTFRDGGIREVNQPGQLLSLSRRKSLKPWVSKKKLKVSQSAKIALTVSHTIHVWYSYLHLVDFYGKCR